MKPRYTHIIGIDNGLTGGLVMLKGSDGSLLRRAPMPVIRDAKLDCKRIHTLRLAQILNHWASDARLEITESQTFTRIMVAAEPCPNHSRDKAAMRSMAFSWGIIVAAIDMARLQVTPVESGRSKTSWQTCLLGRLKKDETKPAALALARNLWPEESFIAEGCRTPHSGMIDAALIAEHLRRIHL
jgi:hypothetical protein